MAFEYKVLESLDYGHPGGSDGRYHEMEEELKQLSMEGWEVVNMAPTMLRGRVTNTGGNTDNLNLTAVTVMVLLRRPID